MDDRELLGKIADLVAEEHRLEHEAEAGHYMTKQQHGRLESLAIQLDQCWDLLRQRRARRAAGLDPDEAEFRPSMIVEHYEQ